MPIQKWREDIDDRRIPHSRCHGVSGSEWYRKVMLAIKHLTTPDLRAKLGIAKIGSNHSHRCDDPDCLRLNRRTIAERPMLAGYMILQELPHVRPADETERFVCQGHPRLPGQYLCEKCARVGVAKRLIDIELETT